MPELQMIFLDEGAKRTRRPTPDLELHVERFMRKMDIYIRSVSAIRSYLYRTKIADDEIQRFADLVKNFGILWRVGLNRPVPPKLHYLESHCVQQAEELGTIGLFCEELIERSHKEDNDLNRVFCTKDFDKCERGKINRKDRDN